MATPIHYAIKHINCHGRKPKEAIILQESSPSATKAFQEYINWERKTGKLSFALGMAYSLHLKYI